LTAFGCCFGGLFRFQRRGLHGRQRLGIAHNGIDYVQATDAIFVGRLKEKTKSEH
jgi:hypothetical protein